MVTGHLTSHLGLELGVHTSFNFLLVLLKCIKWTPIKHHLCYAKKKESLHFVSASLCCISFVCTFFVTLCWVSNWTFCCWASQVLMGSDGGAGPSCWSVVVLCSLHQLLSEWMWKGSTAGAERDAGTPSWLGTGLDRHYPHHWVSTPENHFLFPLS